MMPGRRDKLIACITLILILSGCAGDAPGPGEEQVEADEADITDAMIDAIETITSARMANGIVPRLNQSKSLGCLDARFSVRSDLDPVLAQGVFQPGAEYQALVRFANASTTDDTEKDFRGMSFKLYGISGEPLWGGASEQHFLLNSYPGLFAEDPSEFLAFLEATAEGSIWKFFINPSHWDALKIILQGREVIDSPFNITYWSTTPYRLGRDTTTAVKYSARACDASMEINTERHENFLRDAMVEQLQAGPVCFDFGVQLQDDPVSMPIEDASIIWDESVSPFRTIANLIIEDQAFNNEAALMTCEQQAFNPWHSLPDHRPLGGINRVRLPVYTEAAEFRLQESRYP